MSSPLNKELKTKYGVRCCAPVVPEQRLVQCVVVAAYEVQCVLQVRSVPVRKDDEVQVVRGTFKVRARAVLRTV